MPLQIKRLLLAFAIFLSLFLIVRHFLVPETFGELGHYRAAALDDIAAIETKYADWRTTCVECHTEIVESHAAGEHSNINCQTCHGPALKHTLEPKENNLYATASRENCLKCHEMNSARREKVIKQVDPADHNTESNCIKCHNPHEPWK